MCATEGSRVCYALAFMTGTTRMGGAAVMHALCMTLHACCCSSRLRMWSSSAPHACQTRVSVLPWGACMLLFNSTTSVIDVIMYYAYARQGRVRVLPCGAGLCGVAEALQMLAGLAGCTCHVNSVQYQFNVLIALLCVRPRLPCMPQGCMGLSPRGAVLYGWKMGCFWALPGAKID